MKKYSAMNEIRFSQVKPCGWLREMLEKERDGFPGHLDEIGYPFNLPCWTLKSLADGGFEQWWPYEQTGYWMDSMLRTALLLRDEDMLGKFRAIVDTSIEKAEEDGFIGPDELKIHTGRYQWPHAVYFRGVYALWSATGEEKYLKALERHFMLEGNQFDEDRTAVCIETMLRVAEATQNEALYEKAGRNYLELQQKCADTVDYGYRKMLSDVSTSIHGVTLNEVGRLPAIYYSYFGDSEQLKAVEHLFEKILADHMLPDGVHSSTEGTCGNRSLNAHESCDISDFTWSMGYLLAATGDGKYADLLERAMLNAAPGAIGPDFKTVQYFSSVNQVRAGRTSCHVARFENTSRMAYQPHHYPECCVGNIGRAYPNYVARMYFEDAEGVVLALYGDSEYAGKGLKITQTGGYPFSDTLTFDISCDHPVETALKFRIPGWCMGAQLTLNGKNIPVHPVKGFASLRAVFKDGDQITLRLPMTFTSHISSEGGVYFDYGPLLLTLKIEEEWTQDALEPRQTADFPAWNIEPKTEWRYAVSGNESAELIQNAFSDRPWWSGYPCEFRLTARKLTGWDFLRKEAPGRKTSGNEEGIDARQIALGATEVTDDLVQTPPLPEKQEIAAWLGDEEQITLVPYGCTNLRLTVFPKYGA